jgi:transcriptional regulator with XRE-family HTH domain
MTRSGRLTAEQSAIIGRNVRTLRCRAGWTLARLASLFGRSVSGVCRMELGERGFSGPEVEQLAAIFGVTVEDLLPPGCLNCDGQPPRGFACLACGATGSGPSPIPPAGTDRAASRTRHYVAGAQPEREEPSMTSTITLSAWQLEVAARIDALDLEPIAYKLASPEPGEPAMTLTEADQRIAAYRCFLKLCAWYPGEPIAPSAFLDKAWHAHILDTARYAEDCGIVFGFFLHHFPYFGLRGPDDAAALQASYARTRELFREHFGTDPGNAGQSCSTSCSNGKCSGNQCSSGGCHASAARPRPGRTAGA